MTGLIYLLNLLGVILKSNISHKHINIYYYTKKYVYDMLEDSIYLNQIIITSYPIWYGQLERMRNILWLNRVLYNVI